MRPGGQKRKIALRPTGVVAQRPASRLCLGRLVAESGKNGATPIVEAHRHHWGCRVGQGNPVQLGAPVLPIASRGPQIKFASASRGGGAGGKPEVGNTTPPIHQRRCSMHQTPCRLRL